jgi:hypothetical protein
LEGVVIAVSGAFNDYLLADRVMARGHFRKCLRRLATAEKVMYLEVCGGVRPLCPLSSS